MLPPEQTPDGFQYNQEHETVMREVFHKAGLTPAQASAIWDTMQTEAITGYDNFVSGMTERLNGEHAALKNEWGVKYDENLKLADWVAREFGGDDFIKFLNESKISREPQFLKVAAAIGSKLGEDVQQDTGRASTLMTPAEALSKINAIKGDNSHAYYDLESLQHKEAVTEMEGLFGMAYPEKEKP